MEKMALGRQLAKAYEAVRAVAVEVGDELRFVGSLTEVIVGATGCKEQKAKDHVLALVQNQLVRPIDYSEVWHQVIELPNPEKALAASSCLYRIKTAEYSIEKKVRNMPKLKQDEEKRALELLEILQKEPTDEEGWIKSGLYRRLKMDAGQIARLLRKLVDDDFLERKGNSRWTRYSVRLVKPLEPEIAAMPEPVESKSADEELVERLEQKEFEINSRLLEIEAESQVLKLELEDILEARAGLEAVETARRKARELLAGK